MDMFHVSRHTNILCLCAINLSACTSPPSTLSVYEAFSMEVAARRVPTGGMWGGGGWLKPSWISNDLLCYHLAATSCTCTQE